jgi:hypothetical protein
MLRFDDVYHLEVENRAEDYISIQDANSYEYSIDVYADDGDSDGGH